MPIVLDVGTNDAERLDDPGYLGSRHERLTALAYFGFVDQFVRPVQQELPNTCLQWEDFATPHARPIPERYRDELLTFNDDIQGTAAVALGAILGAVGVTGKRLRDQQMVLLGAGSAAVGVADYPRNLWLRILKDGFGPSSMIFADDMADRPITRSDCRALEALGNVPKGAVKFDNGLALAGSVRAWIDSVALEVIE